MNYVIVISVIAVMAFLCGCSDLCWTANANRTCPSIIDIAIDDQVIVATK